MTMPVVLALIIAVLAALLTVLLRGIDVRELRDRPSGLLSMGGLWATVGGGFLVGLAYGFVMGLSSGSPTAEWAGRGIIDGLVVSCAGAFYLGYQQRRHGRGSGRGPSEGPGGDREDDGNGGGSGDGDRER